MKSFLNGFPSWEVIFDLATKRERLVELEKAAENPDYWKDRETARKGEAESAGLRKDIETVAGLEQQLSDLVAMAELLAGEKDEGLAAELDQGKETLARQLGRAEFRRMLDGEHDRAGALLTIHPGAGGTESQDWAQMLSRMYSRWGESRGYKQEVLDLLPGEEAGIKSVTIAISGDYAFGYLRVERGVHRLVRISPFDANKRRHTSFASVDVIPDIEDSIEMDISDEELKVDTYRAGGAGGQHVNKVESAVRITHLPTGIVAQCQSERSQHKNRGSAMKILKARVYAHRQEELARERKEASPEKKEIAWGNQIRSYVFQPYTMVKDHRTNYEMGNVNAVMDGDLDKFMEEALKQKV